jgi:putative ABC transport system permease protein
MNAMVDLLVETQRGLRAQAFRFGLAALGMAWGVAMLTYLSASAEGYDRHFAREIAKVGERIVFLFPGSITKQTVGQRGARVLDLERDDVDRLATLAVVERAAPNTWVGPRVVRAGRRTKLVWLHGASADTAPVRNYELALGRGLSPADVQGGARVIFLGARAAERLFGRAPAVGRAVHIDGIPFTVVGVAAKKGHQLVFVGPGDDEVGFVPITTAQRWFTHTRRIDQVIFQPRSRQESWEALDRVRGLTALHQRYRADDDTALGAFNVQEVVQIVEALLLALRAFLTAASIVTLIAGAVGVTNIMLVMVAERTREFGLRKALGASNRALAAQVMAETLALTLSSGGIGLVIGWLGVRASVAALAGHENTMQGAPVLTVPTAVLVVATLVVIGVIAGAVPARRAMRVDPAVALRAV